MTDPKKITGLSRVLLETKSAYGSWVLIIGYIVSAISIFRLVNSFLHIGLSNLLELIMRSYITIFHFPFYVLAHVFGIELSDPIKDALILWLLASMALNRTLQSFQALHEGGATLRLLGVDPDSEEARTLGSNDYNVPRIGLRYSGYYHIFFGFKYVRPTVIGDILAILFIMSSWPILFVLILVDDCYWRIATTDDDGYIIKSSEVMFASFRGILLIQILTISAAIVGIIILNAGGN